MTFGGKTLVNLGILATTGLSGWYLGQHSQKQHVQSQEDQSSNLFSKIPRLPGLPLYGTVSAATAVVPVDSNETVEGRLSMPESRVAEIMKYGFPGLDHVRSFEDFVLSYDRRTRVAHWVFEHLSKERLPSDAKVNRASCEFKPDPSIHSYFRSDNRDYKGSGYDRGHLAAAGNHKLHQKHMEQTFFLSNMAPQVGVGFNRDSWNRLEKYVRGLTKTHKNVYVCTGPLYLPKREADGKKYVRYEVIGTNNVAVPTHFYKVIVCETHDSKLEMEAYVMPNAPIDDNTPLTNFQVPPDSIERAAGLLFFDRISRDKLSRINTKLLT